MISKRAVKEFLNRDLDDWSCVKDLSEEEIWEELDSELPEDFAFKTPPWKHQAASFICGLHNKNFLFFLDMGAGKSLVSASLIEYYALTSSLKGRTLIVAPNEVAIDTWIEQIAEHTDGTSTPLIGDATERWKLLEENETNFYIITFSSLTSMLTGLKEGKGKKEGRKERKPIPKLVNKISKMFKGLIIDEIHNCKNPQSLNYKMVNKIAANCEYRYGLTGTPFGRDPIDLWAQFFLVDRGETLGKTLGLYREAFFIAESNGFGKKYVFNKKLWEKLYKTLCHKSIRYKEEELENMPPKVYLPPIKVSFSSEQYQYYEKAINNLKEAKGNFQMIENSFMRLRQITSGYIDFKDEEGNRERIIFKQNPLLDALIEDLDNLPIRAKLLIFTEFTLSGDMIAERLKKKKIKFARLYGGTKDKTKEKNTFLNDPKCRIFLLASKSGNSNLNCQIADYEYFYESPVSPIIRSQAEKRAPRGDKKETTYIKDFVVKNSVDERVLEFIREGKDLFQLLINGKDVL